MIIGHSVDVEGALLFQDEKKHTIVMLYSNLKRYFYLECVHNFNLDGIINMDHNKRRCTQVYYVLKPNVLPKMRDNTFCRTELEYFYNEDL